MTTYKLTLQQLLLWVIVAYLGIGPAKGQTPTSSLNLDTCFQLAKQNYPLVQQYRLLEQNQQLSLQNTQRAYWPQVQVAGQATYQSEVTELPITLPAGITVPSLNKDQYRVYAEVNQSLTDFYQIKQQQQLIAAQTDLEAQKIDVELYKLRDRVTQLFFGILLIDAQLQQSNLLEQDIKTGLQKAKVAINNGVALKSSAYILEAELIKLSQRQSELKANRKGLSDMLALFTGLAINENTSFEQPLNETVSTSIKRPELKVFDYQQNTFSIQQKLVDARKIPRVGVFLQGGLGRPGLNMLNNEFSPYYIGGLRFSWNVSSFYTAKNDKAMLDLNSQAVGIQREAFLFNIAVQQTQQNAEVAKYQTLMQQDAELIELRQRIKDISKTQLENGVINANDYLIQVNAEDQARQNLALHRIQWHLANYYTRVINGE